MLAESHFTLMLEKERTTSPRAAQGDANVKSVGPLVADGGLESLNFKRVAESLRDVSSGGHPEADTAVTSAARKLDGNGPPPEFSPADVANGRSPPVAEENRKRLVRLPSRIPERMSVCLKENRNCIVATLQR